jgi:5'-3' exonuclease
MKERLIAAGKNVPDMFDSNAISPGTQFMAELSRQLHFFVKYKVNTDPLYKCLKNVVVSDASSPGEGEHKIMDYIRNLRLDAEHDPNTRHCFYGPDADLIMLALLTHEPHFNIIREEHVRSFKRDGGVVRNDLSVGTNFQLIHINLLREYFALEYKPLAAEMKIAFDVERIIDDFIFFCFFIGNDFLPSLSSLDISEGSLDKIIEFYKTCLPTMENYITENGTVHWDRAEPLLVMLGEHENEVFENRVTEISSRYVSQKKRFDDKAHEILLDDHFDKRRFELNQKKQSKFNALEDKFAYKKLLYKRKFEEEDESKITAIVMIKRTPMAAKLKKAWKEYKKDEIETAEPSIA